MSYHSCHFCLVVTHATTVYTDEDFTLDLPMSFTFSSADEVMSITLTVIDDNLLEVTESFAVSLFKDISIPDVNINPDRGIATVEIIDDESKLAFHLPRL